MFARLSNTIRYLAGYPVQSAEKESKASPAASTTAAEQTEEVVTVTLGSGFGLMQELPPSPKNEAPKRKLSSSDIALSLSPKRSKSTDAEEVALQPAVTLSVVVPAEATVAKPKVVSPTVQIYPVGPYHGNPANIYNAAHQKPSYSAVVKGTDEPAPPVLSRRM